MKLTSSFARLKHPPGSALQTALFLTVVLLSASSSQFVAAQMSSAGLGSDQAVPSVLAGRVVNAVTGAPIPRALVQVNGRAILSDAEGSFRFEQPGQPASAIRVNKPGFSTSPEQMDGVGSGVLEGADPGSVTLALWPEGLLTGTVIASDGEPLSRISVLARRSVFDEQGHRFQIAGRTQTDSHGKFRIPVTAGEYVVETQFSPRGFERDQAVLPFSFPASGSAASAPTLHVGSGEEQNVDLRPVVSTTHVVTLPLDAGDEGPPPRIWARSSNGVSFAANASRSQSPGSIRLNLPSGSYSLSATRFSRDGMQFGDSTIEVPDHDVTASPLHLTSLPVIPVEVVGDATSPQTPAAGSGGRIASAPPAMQFNLMLEPTEPDSTSSFQFGIHPTQQRDGSVSLAAPPGAYRLSASLAGGWYVRSAISRGTDLMRESLVISPSSSPSPITLVVSNQTGSLQGTVKLSGSPTACWIYLIASSPALPAVIVRRSDAGGGLRITDLPPGSYRAIAFPFRHSADFQDSATLTRFETHVATVSITPGGTAELDLDAVTMKELVP